MIKQTRIIMGMPVILMTPDARVTVSSLDKIFGFLEYADQKYSPFIATSDVALINQKQLATENYDDELQEILALAAKTKHETNGYFDVWHNENFDPSGIVKGWAIQKASQMMQEFTDDFYVEAGGDIQVGGNNDMAQPWRIGIRNPFERNETISVVELQNHAVATSGTAIRGQHIYNPFSPQPIKGIVSLSVIAPAIVDADRIATAAFAMREKGIQFIESLKGYEGYMVDSNKRATKTTGWEEYEVQP
jgi:thiamine biosynthesis lipoprotein